MDNTREPAPEAQDPGSAGGAAIAANLRIGGSLDLDSVLREPVDAASRSIRFVWSGDYRVDTFPDQHPHSTFGSKSDASLARPGLCGREGGKPRPTPPMPGGGTRVLTRIRRSSEVIAGRLSSLHRAYGSPARGLAIRSGPEERYDLRTPAPGRDIAAALTGSQCQAR